MNIPKHMRSIAVTLSVFLILSAFLAYIGTINYPLFHTLAEMTGIIIACGIFMIAVATRRIADNEYLLFLGIAYAAVAVLDLFHTLTYKGVGIFQDVSVDIPTQLWIAARYVESLSLAAAPYFLYKKLPLVRMSVLYFLATGGLILFILVLRFFPACYIEGAGLTMFKIVSEYIICGVLLFTIALLYRERKSMDPQLYFCMVFSLILTTLSEIMFTLYISVFGFANLVGHLLKIASFYLIFRGVILRSLENPYYILFRNLTTQKETLRRQNQSLSEIVDRLKGEKETAEQQQSQSRTERLQDVQDRASQALQKSDAAQEKARMVREIMDLREEVEILQDQLNYYVGLVEQTKGSITDIISDDF